MHAINKIVFLLLILLDLPAYASEKVVKPHAQAKKLLANIQVPTTFQADFKYISMAKESTEEQVVQGTIWIKDDKYKLLLDEQLIISNGETIWNYLPALHEVHIHTYEPAATTEGIDALSPIQLLHMYQEDYIPTHLQHITIHQEKYAVIDLITKDKESCIPKLSLTIDIKKNLIKEVKALDNQGKVHSFIMLNIVSDIDFADSYFEFKLSDYQDEHIEVIDLR